MKLKNAINFFESALSETSQKSEIKIYGQFLQILNGLKSREFNETEMLSIEIELNLLRLESNPKNRKKFFKKALQSFETYLNETYSLIAKGHYSSLGLVFGMSIGMFLGLIFLFSLDRSMGIVIGSFGGMIVGNLIGNKLDAQAVAEGRAL